MSISLRCYDLHDCVNHSILPVSTSSKLLRTQNLWGENSRNSNRHYVMDVYYILDTILGRSMWYLHHPRKMQSVCARSFYRPRIQGSRWFNHFCLRSYGWWVKERGSDHALWLQSTCTFIYSLITQSVVLGLAAEAWPGALLVTQHPKLKPRTS